MIFRRTLVALVASLALGAGIAPGVAAPRIMAGPGHGFAGHAFAGHAFSGHGFSGHSGPWFHGGRYGPGWRSSNRSLYTFGFVPGFLGYGYGPYAYGYGPYGYGSNACWQPRRVLTPSGWHWREAWVCG
jgi:hypothetical protein